jgi:Tol biopolymer transport system component
VASASAVACPVFIRGFSGGYEPAWSPDGRRVALTWWNRSSGSAAVDLWDSTTRKLSFVALGSHPSWSSDGTQLTYQSDVPLSRTPDILSCGPSTQSDLFVTQPGIEPVNASSTDQRWESSPSWSPDGRELLFSFTETGGTGLGLLDLATRQETVLASSPFSSNADYADPSWSPDGRMIAYTLNNQIVVSTRTGTVVTTVTAPGRLYLGTVRWSPDGRELAFSASGDHYESGLFLVNAGGRNLRRLTRGWHSNPSWSPDGRKLAFVGPARRQQLNGDRSSATRIYVLTVNGRNRRIHRLF